MSIVNESQKKPLKLTLSKETITKLSREAGEEQNAWPTTTTCGTVTVCCTLPPGRG